MGKKAPSVTMTFRAETLKRLEIAEELVKFDHPTTPQQHFDVGNLHSQLGDNAKAAISWEKAAAGGHRAADARLGRERALTQLGAHTPEHRCLLCSTPQGQYQMAIAIDDPQEKKRWLEKAAEAQHADAMTLLASHVTGHDNYKAALLLRGAADAGNITAISMLVARNQTGTHGFKKNTEHALKLMQTI